MNPLRNRTYLWLAVGVILTLAIAADPPFGFDSLSIVASVVAGALLGLGASHYYSRQASEELSREADNLRQETEDVRHYVNALISYLEAAGMIEVRRNENGRPIKIQIIRLSGVIGGGGGFGGELSVGQKEPPPDATSEADHSDEDP